MSHKPTPPAPASCLMKPYRASPDQKGGTLIAEGIYDLDEHERLVLDPDGYRPACCPTCEHAMMHSHDLRTRRRRDLPPKSYHEIRRYVCAVCEALWQVLPAFLARHLQRAWETIEQVAVAAGLLPETRSARGAEPTPTPSVPKTTRRRYLARLSACAAALRAAFAAMEAGIDHVLGKLSEQACRAQFCCVLGDGGHLPAERRLATLAAWLHRLVPGLRLM